MTDAGAAAEAERCLDEVQDDGAGSVVRRDSADVDVRGGSAAEAEDVETAKRRGIKKSAGRAGAGKRVTRRALTRTMAEWQQTCRKLNLPDDSREFTDYVLVFDVLETSSQDDVTYKTGAGGCCNCCQPSPKEMHESLDVRASQLLSLSLYHSICRSGPSRHIRRDDVRDDVTSQWLAVSRHPRRYRNVST